VNCKRVAFLPLPTPGTAQTTAAATAVTATTAGVTDADAMGRSQSALLAGPILVSRFCSTASRFVPDSTQVIPIKGPVLVTRFGSPASHFVPDPTASRFNHLPRRCCQ
jgi:hypothetical protein